ncbi:unnamed protein product [Urochloa humidicola]
MDATSSSDARIAAHGAPTILPLPSQVLVDVEEEELKNSTERLEGDVSARTVWMHRFPHNLRGIRGPDNRYVEPSLVAIGPYHHHLPHLQKMQEVKVAAAKNFCTYLGCSEEEVYRKIFTVAIDARRCYDASSPSMAKMSDEVFAEMMRVDGCFLLWFMTCQNDPLLIGCMLSSGPIFYKDLFLLENQIPWLVLDALTEFMKQDYNGVLQAFLIEMVSPLSPINQKKSWEVQWGCIPHRVFKKEGQGAPATTTWNYKPPHLLGLLWFFLIRNLPAQKRESKQVVMEINGLSIGAMELVQSGVKLTASASTVTAGRFADMKCQKKDMPFFSGELSLSPLFLNDTVVSWLVNMAALESAEVMTNPVSWDVDGYVVSSYLSMLAMLMDREEDVHELRRSGVLNSIFSNAQTLDFFKCLGQNLRLGHNYFNTLGEIDAYMSRRPVRIAVYKFFYNNKRTIAAILSIAGALIGILKALYSLKKP